MKLIKSRLFSRRKCEFGNFELKPDEGWKLSQTFIDFESGLLVVSVSDENEANWEDLGFGGRRIPNKQFIIHPETAEILDPAEWKKYFHYEKVITETADKRYKLTTQRIHEPEQNTDSIIEELEDLESGQKSTSQGVAFREKKRENLLESQYRSIHEAQKQKELLDAKPTLEEFSRSELEKLTGGEVILGYLDEAHTYQLTYSDGKWILLKGGKLPVQYDAWKSLEFEAIKTYSGLDEFWSHFTQEAAWFLKFRMHHGLSEKPHVLSARVISVFNELRREHRFTFSEYNRINEWENSFWSDEFKRTEMKQWCANCSAEVYYQARYPKYICRECASKEITDEHGNLLEFSNTGFSGGFRVITKNREGAVLKEDDSNPFCDCIIEGKLFFAQEARFGGIVIQLKDTN